MKKVLMIVQNDFVNDWRIIKEANTLGSNGYQVRVLSLHNDGLKIKEDFDHFEVERIRLKTRNRLSKTNRYIQIFKYLEFYRKCAAKGSRFEPDVVHCHDLSTLPIGEKILKAGKRKMFFIYDSHELWRGLSFGARGEKFLSYIKGRIEERTVNKCDRVITVSDSIVRWFSDTYRLKRPPLLLRNIPPGLSRKIHSDILRKTFKVRENQKILLFMGSVGPGRGLETIIRAFHNIDDRVVMVILGNGNYKTVLKDLASRLNLEQRIFFHPAVPFNDLMTYASSADAGLCLYENLCLSYYYTLPNKMFEYMQAELPFICSDFPDMRAVADKYRTGLAVNPESGRQIVEAVHTVMLDESFYRGYLERISSAKETLTWQNEGKKLLKMYDSLFNETH